MSQPASKPACINDGCDRESRTFKPGPCRRCYERARTGYAPSPLFPVAPIREYAARKGISLRDIDLTGENFTLEKADELCIDRLGAHPFEVYGNYYFAA